VIDVRSPSNLERTLAELPDWYVDELASGGVVEELIRGRIVTSPSVQLDLRPDGAVQVLATHEQVLGGPSGQVYMGCRFPADADYAAQLARDGNAIGRLLAERGARGRASIDFVAASDAAGSGSWDLFALEVNLRKGGTTHPYAVLRNLVPGRYDAERGRWIAAKDGTTRAYWSTDNLVDPSWTGLSPRTVIEALARAGLQFDIDRGTGVVLHMFAGLAIDGRLGITAIGHDTDHAGELYDAAARAIAGGATSN
jgi:hypothetical protein